VLRAAALVAGKDLRIEARSRVATNQVIPFAFCILLVFAFALDPDRGTLTAAAPGLYWVAILFSTVLGAQRSFGLEAADGTRDALRLSGLEPAGVFLGKAGALALQLLVLEVLLGVGVLVLYTTDLRASGIILLIVAALVTTAGLAATSTLFGALSAGVRVRETLLPLLLIPTVTPVLIGATRAYEAALGTGGASTSEGWPWVGLLGVFALAYSAFGLLGFGALMEEA
jgi:heme exporter protein B